MSTTSLGLTGSANAITINNTNGFVGIGTTTPSTALQVAGTVTATGYAGLPLATSAAQGVVQVPTANGLSVSGGSLAMGVATSSAVGAVSVGAGLSVNGSGVIVLAPQYYYGTCNTWVASGSALVYSSVVSSSGITCSSGGSFSVTKAGVYHVTFQGKAGGAGTIDQINLYLAKNGITYATSGSSGSANATWIRPNACLPCILALTTTDTFTTGISIESGPGGGLVSAITIIQIG